MMMTEQLARETVVLESLGPVEISQIFVPVDDFGHRATGRPNGGYYEVAILWGENAYGGKHCYIVDSNLVDREPTDALVEWLSEAAHLAKFMVHMFHIAPSYEYE